VRGWRRFRRLPAVAQAAAWLALVAAYSLLMVVLLTGGEEERTVGVPGTGKARPMTAEEQRVARLLERAHAPVPGQEPTDVPRFRRPHIRTVTCRDGCRQIEVLYSVGLPGRGRILQDQRPMWEVLFSRTPVVKGTMTVTRDTAAAGVPPKRGEETPAGAPLLTTRCDRSTRPNVDWGSVAGAKILHNICEVDGYDQGEIHRQEPVAPDDETAGDVEVP